MNTKMKHSWNFIKYHVRVPIRCDTMSAALLVQGQLYYSRPGSLEKGHFFDELSPLFKVE